MVGASDPGPTAAINADAVWDEARADHVAGGSAGQFLLNIMDGSLVGHGFTAGSGIDMLSTIGAKAIAAGATANSIAQKLRGMTDNQAVPTVALTITNQDARTSTAENITTTITPPAASLTVFKLWGESLPAVISALETSTNSGTNFFDPGAAIAPLEAATETASTIGNANPIVLGANGRLRWTTPGTVGTYIVSRAGASIS
jgi:hypothetical protein